MASLFKVKYNSPAQLGDSIVITNKTPFDPDYTVISLNYNSVLPVTGNIQNDVDNLFNFFSANYPNYNLSKDLGNTELIVQDPSNNAFFQESVLITGNRIELIIENQPIIDDLEFTNVLISSGSSDNQFNLSVETNRLAKGMTSPVLIYNNTENPILVSDIDRDDINNILISVYVEDTLTNTITKQIFVPNIIPSNFSVNVSQTPSNNTITVVSNFNNTPYFTLSYSLDDVNYYSSSSFSGLVKGDYTIYIKDSLGVKTSLPFTINDFTPNVYKRVPLIDFSKNSSLIHVARDGKRNTYKNTLSVEESNSMGYCYFQPFQIGDGFITNQFKTSYRNIKVELFKSVFGKMTQQQELPITKVTDLVDKVDNRDALALSVDYANNKYLGIQYRGGNIYDKNGNVEGNYYDDGTIPDFMSKDDVILLNSVYFTVIDVVFLDNRQTLILNTLYNNAGIGAGTYIVQSVYNVQDFDFYENYINVDSLKGDYCLKYEFTDDDNSFPNQTYVTEVFNVNDYQRNTYLLEYYNTFSDTNTYYKDDTRFKIRLPYESPLYHTPVDEVNNFDTDTNTVSIKSTTRSQWTLDVLNIPTNLSIKLDAITTNDMLFINEISYVKTEANEKTRVGQSNRYRTKVLLQESNYVYSNTSEDLTSKGTVLGTGVVKTALGTGK